MMDLKHYRTIIDLLNNEEARLVERIDRTPKTRARQPNPLVRHLQDEANAIAEARLAFKEALRGTS